MNLRILFYPTHFASFQSDTISVALTLGGNARHVGLLFSFHIIYIQRYIAINEVWKVRK